MSSIQGMTGTMFLAAGFGVVQLGAIALFLRNGAAYNRFRGTFTRYEDPRAFRRTIIVHAVLAVVCFGYVAYGAVRLLGMR